MKKLVTLKLVNVSYGGVSIGDDIRITVAAGGVLMSFDQKLSPGAEIVFDEKIMEIITEESRYTLPINISIVERDVIFDDAGTTEKTLTIDLNDESPQRSTHHVTVKELRGIRGGKTATFDVVFEANVRQPVFYVPEVERGWLRVVRESDASLISLPAYLSVQPHETNGGREYFTIMEGLEVGNRASVRLQEDGSSYLTIGYPYTDPVQLKYSISKKILAVDGKSYATRDYPEAPWEMGTYDIELPDAPHPGGRPYPVEHAMTWFRVDHNGDRYIHMGNASLGCITVIEHRKWEEIYEALVKARAGDAKSVGTLEVVD